jgi:hypothetical protein
MATEPEMKEEDQLFIVERILPENSNWTHQMICQLMNRVSALEDKVTSLETEIADLRGHPVPVHDGDNAGLVKIEEQNVDNPMVEINRLINGFPTILEGTEQEVDSAEPIFVEVPRNSSPDQSTFGSALQETPAQVSIDESHEILDKVELCACLEEVEPIAGPSGVSEINTQRVLDQTIEPEQPILQALLQAPTASYRKRKSEPETPQNSTPAKQKYVSINHRGEVYPKTLTFSPLHLSLSSDDKIFRNPDGFVEKILRKMEAAGAKNHGKVEMRVRETLKIKEGLSFQFEVFGLKNAGLGNGLDSECCNIFLCNGNFTNIFWC